MNITEPITTVHLLNRNTDKYIDVTVPIAPETNTFAQEGAVKNFAQIYFWIEPPDHPIPDQPSAVKAA